MSGARRKMTDTEVLEARIERLEQINEKKAERLALEKEYGQVWDTKEVTTDFEVISFLAPYVHVKRKSDGKAGSLEFQHSPRYYFNFEEK